MINQTTCGLGALEERTPKSTTERDLCFFLGDPKVNERQLAAPQLGDQPHSKLPDDSSRTGVERSYLRATLPSQIRLRASGPVSTIKERRDAPVWFPARPCNLFPHLPVRSAGIQQAGHYADPMFALGH